MEASQVMSNERHLKASAEELARKWKVGLETARDTMNKTASPGLRTPTETIYSRLRVDHLDFYCKRLKGN